MGFWAGCVQGGDGDGARAGEVNDSRGQLGVCYDVIFLQAFPALPLVASVNALLPAVTMIRSEDTLLTRKKRKKL